MFKKRLAGSALVLSLVLMVPHASMAMGEEKNSIVKDIGAGVVSLGALVGAACGLYWANDYDVKKTVKPFIGLAAIGSALTASYFCFGKFLWRKFVKSANDDVKSFMKDQKEQFKTEINDLGETAKKKLKEVKDTVEGGLTQKLKQVQDTFNFYLERIKPQNVLKSSNQILQQMKREEFKGQVERSNNEHRRFDTGFLHETYTNGTSSSHLNESVVVISENEENK